MLYELVMLPPSGGQAFVPGGQMTSAAAGGYGGAAGLQTALTGVPLNKGLHVALPSPVSGVGHSQKVDTTGHHHIFVGDLAPEIESHQLKEAFSVFGLVTECKIIKDMHTQKPKGYGFVAFANKDEAEDAMVKMNGQLLGSRTIRTNWAVRKPQQTPDPKPLNYDEVAQASSASNCTVYVGGITRGLCEEMLRDAFKDFGVIQEVRVFKEKGYAFVRFDTHEGAARAIVTMHGKDVGGQPCKCSWGKECSDKENSGNLLAQYGYYTTAATAASVNPLAYQTYASQLGYLQQPLGYNYAAAAAAAAAAAGSAAAASGTLLGGYSGAAAAAFNSPLANQAFATPTSAAITFQHAHQA